MSIISLLIVIFYFSLIVVVLSLVKFVGEFNLLFVCPAVVFVCRRPQVAVGIGLTSIATKITLTIRRSKRTNQ